MLNWKRENSITQTCICNYIITKIWFRFRFTIPLSTLPVSMLLDLKYFHYQKDNRIASY